MWSKITKWVTGCAAAIVGYVSFANLAMADDLADMFTAVDVTAVSTGVKTILIALIGISLLFLGYHYARRAMGR